MLFHRLKITAIAVALCVSFLFASLGASAADAGPTVKSDGQTASELGLLAGDGHGVNSVYLSKKTTRLQAAIISLKLQGHLREAIAYTGMSNFTDVQQVSTTNQAILAYLKNHPEYGWSGTGHGKFDPGKEISAQQFYKVLLEVLGYHTDSDFAYADTESYAATKGLRQIMGTSTLQNAHIATALIEALSAKAADGRMLFDVLKSKGVLSTDAELPRGERIALNHNDKLGTYFTDRNGMALYFYTKDAEDLNACQGQCIANWPVYYADQLQIPATLNADDFSVLTRTDGTKQLTYKNWPLYYFVKDKAAGDVNGEAVGGVWFLAKSDYAFMLGTSAKLGNYLTDDYGRTLYYFDKDPAQTSVCEGNCLVNWPAYFTSGKSLPSNMNSQDLGTITRSDGRKQTSYKGFPMYYFIKDEAHGDVKGQNVNDVWFVVDPAQFTGTAASKVKTYHIDIKEFSFGTGPLTVKAGSQVTFTNFDDMEHSAVAVDGSFASPLLSKGESYTVTLNKVGTIDFYCEPHKAFMTGKIIVK